MATSEHSVTDRHPVLWKAALLVLVVSGIVWLGAVNIRAIIGSDMLKTGTLEFESYLPPDAEREIFRLLSLTSLVVIGGYAVTLVSSVIFLAASPFRLRQNGWLLMSAILFYIFVPVELFTIALDARMVYNEFFTTTDNSVFRQLFIARVSALAGAPAVATLCYYTIIGLAVFRPLIRKDVVSHEA
jgi:hypothetical protein